MVQDMQRLGIPSILARAIGFAAMAAAMAPAPALAQEAIPAGYRLVWSDEFDIGSTPNPANWDFEEGFLRNRELQWYQQENAFVQDGLLVIEARAERRENPGFRPNSAQGSFAARRFINYTSASVTTRGRHAWQYGRFEVRARLSAQQGLWPAIWFLGEEGTWPERGEIDLLEYYDHSVLANFAWAERARGQALWQSRKLPLTQLTDDPDWAAQFHTWVMEWDEQAISLYLDGRLMNQLALDTVHSHAAAPLANPFRQPHHLILNLALGGQQGGPVRDTRFPARFEIDYVRVYQREETRQ
jgi:beta-glucanase (GH16 family)